MSGPEGLPRIELEDVTDEESRALLENFQNQVNKSPEAVKQALEVLDRHPEGVMDTVKLLRANPEMLPFLITISDIVDSGADAHMQFDDTTEDIIAEDPTTKWLIKQSRDPSKSPEEKEKSSRRLRRWRASLFVGRVAATAA